MFIAERIIGVITYMSIMLLFFLLIYKAKDKKKTKKLLILYWLVLGTMAFFYIPAESADLSRLLEKMHRYTTITFLDLLQLIKTSNTPSESLYYWVISRIKIDGLLPCITALIFYGNTFYILYKMREKYSISNKNIAYSLLLFMSFGRFLDVISGIRSLMAFSIIAKCIYDEVIEKKSIIKNIILYIFAAFMHPAAMVLITLRFVQILFSKNQKKIIKVLNIIIILLLTYLAIRMANNTVEATANKVTSYFTRDTYSYIWEFIICWIYIVFSTVTLIFNRKQLKENIETRELGNIILMTNILVIIFNYEYATFSRFTGFSSILFLPLLGFILEKMTNNKSFTYLFLITIFIMIALVGTRGDLSGYKYLLF